MTRPFFYYVDRLEGHYEDGEILTSSAVHMPEFHGKICDALWTDQITDHFQIKERGPIYIGNNISYLSTIGLIMYNCKSSVEGDVYT